MKLGLFGLNTGVLSHPDAIARVARSAEAAGYESLWTGEHVVLIDPQQPPSPVPPQTRFLDQVAVLSFAAALNQAVATCSITAGFGSDRNVTSAWRATSGTACRASAPCCTQRS